MVEWSSLRRATRIARHHARHHASQLAKIAINHGSRRRYHLRTEAFDLLGFVSPSVAVESDGLRYYVDTSDFGFSRTVFAQGSYEQDVMADALGLLGRLAGGEPLAGRTFLDIGANIGTSTIPALKVFGARDAIAFEPEPRNHRLLRCNLIANELDDRVLTRRVALSDRTTTGELEIDAHGLGDHRVRSRSGLRDGPYGESERSTIEVLLVRFDDLAQEIPIDLSLAGVAWMDVQGHEGHVLAGARSLLGSDVPVITEYWPYGLDRSGGKTLFHGLVAEHYERVVDVRASMLRDHVVAFEAAALDRLGAKYTALDYTDLILLKG